MRSSLAERLQRRDTIQTQYRAGQNEADLAAVSEQSEGAITDISSNTLTKGGRNGGVQNLELPQALAPASTPTFAKLRIAGGTFLSRMLFFTGSLDFGSVAAQSSADLTIAVAGAQLGDVVACSMPAAPAGTSFICVGVTAADTVTFRFLNATAGAVDPASGTFSGMVLGV